MAFAFYSLLLPPEHWLRLLTAYCFERMKIIIKNRNAEQSSWGLPSSNINTHYEILKSVLYSGGHYSSGHSRVKLAQWIHGIKHLNPISHFEHPLMGTSLSKPLMNPYLREPSISCLAFTVNLTVTALKLRLEVGYQITLSLQLHTL